MKALGWGLISLGAATYFVGYTETGQAIGGALPVSLNGLIVQVPAWVEALAVIAGVVVLFNA